MSETRPSETNRYELVFAGFMAVFVTFVVLTNTVGVLGLGVLLGYLPLAAVVPIIPQAVVEAILAAVVTVVVVRGVMLYRSGQTTAPEPGPDEEKRY